MSGAGHRGCCAPCGPGGVTFDVCEIDPATECAPAPDPPFPYPGTCIDWPAAIEIELPESINMGWLNSSLTLCEGEEFNAGSPHYEFLNDVDPSARFDYELQGPNPFQLPCETPDEFNAGGIVGTGQHMGLLTLTGSHRRLWFSQGLPENYVIGINPGPDSGGSVYEFPGAAYSVVRAGPFDTSLGFFGYYKDYAIRDVDAPVGQPCLNARMCVGTFIFRHSASPSLITLRHITSVCVATHFESPYDYQGSSIGRILFFMRSCNHHASQVNLAGSQNVPLEVINMFSPSLLQFDGWTLGMWNKDRPGDTNTGMADCANSSIDLDYVVAATDHTQGPSSVVGANLVYPGTCTPIADVGSVTFPTDDCYPADLTEPFPVHYRTVAP